MLPQSISHAAYSLPALRREEIEDLKHAVDLRAEIERDLGPGQRSGKWRKYRSPFREERKPSFGVCEGVFIDFATGQRGDILTWLQDYRGLDFREALTWLTDHVRGAMSSYFPGLRPSPTVPVIAATLTSPSAAWQQLALHELEQAEHCLWSKVGAKALAYLRTVRGLDDETIRRFRLGFNPTWKRTQHRSSASGKPAHLAPGIVIPWFYEGQLWALKVRCRVGNLAQALGIKPDYFLDKGKRTEAPKYLNLADGNQAGLLFNADSLTPEKPVLLVEGEFDAMLAWQLAHDDLTTVTLGSAAYELPACWRERLVNTPVILSALDNDEAGQKATHKLAAALGKQMCQVRLPVGKDLTEFVVDHHGDARTWLHHLRDVKPEANGLPPEGLPDAVRQASLTFLTAALTLVAELWQQAVQRCLLTCDQPFTIQQLCACSQQLGWEVKASTITEALATDQQAGEVFFEKLAPETLQESSVLENTGSNHPKKGGRPADHYRAKPMQAIVEALLLHAYFRLTERRYPVGGQALAEVDAAWFTALGFKQAEAERLAACAREQFADLPIDRQARASVQRDYNALRRDLQRVLDGAGPSSPLPAEWNYSTPSEYRAAVLRALVEATPDQRRSRRSLAHSIGVSEASVSAYLERAGLENVEQFEDRLLGAGDLAGQVRQAERRCQGYARRLIGMDREAISEFAFNWQSLPRAERWVRAQQAAGVSVFVRLQVASVQRVTPVPRTTGQATVGCVKQQRSRASDGSAKAKLGARCLRRVVEARALLRQERYLGPTFDPAWVREQLLLGIALATGRVYQPGRVYALQTGEVVAVAETIFNALGQSLHGVTNASA